MACTICTILKSGNMLAACSPQETPSGLWSASIFLWWPVQVCWRRAAPTISMVCHGTCSVRYWHSHRPLGYECLECLGGWAQKVSGDEVHMSDSLQPIVFYILVFQLWHHVVHKVYGLLICAVFCSQFGIKCRWSPPHPPQKRCLVMKVWEAAVCFWNDVRNFVFVSWIP